MARQHKINKSKNQGQPFSGYWTEPTARRKPRSKKFSSWPPRCSRERFPAHRGALGCTASTGTLPQDSVLLSPLPGAEGKSVQGWLEPRGTHVHIRFLYSRGFFNNQPRAQACSPLPAHALPRVKATSTYLSRGSTSQPAPQSIPALLSLHQPAPLSQYQLHQRAAPKPFPALPLPSPPTGSVSA